MKKEIPSLCRPFYNGRKPPKRNQSCRASRGGDGGKGGGLPSSPTSVAMQVEVSCKWKSFRWKCDVKEEGAAAAPSTPFPCHDEAKKRVVSPLHPHRTRSANELARQTQDHDFGRPSAGPRLVVSARPPGRRPRDRDPGRCSASACADRPIRRRAAQRARDSVGDGKDARKGARGKGGGRIKESWHSSQGLRSSRPSRIGDNNHNEGTNERGNSSSLTTTNLEIGKFFRKPQSQ